MNLKLDAIDRKLLALVQADSSLPYAALGEAVGLSVSAVNERVRKLERSGAILGYMATLDPAAVGAEVLAFVELGFSAASRADAFGAAIAARSEVMEVHRITGEREILLKLRTASLASLETLIDALVGGNDRIASSRVTLVLHSTKETPAIPVPEAAPG
jgi:Lrp/AsnC family leucine-responsive transcriptional regulator